jgi:putative endonuclease
MKCHMYILLCANDTSYTVRTKHLEQRITQHQNGEKANYTKKHAPVKLMYTKEFDRIDYAFNREKQIQNWSKKKKAALINGDIEELKKAAKKKF